MSEQMEIWNTLGTWAGAVANAAVVWFTLHVLRRDANEKAKRINERSALAAQSAAKAIASIRKAVTELKGVHPDVVEGVAKDRLGSLQRSQDIIAEVLKREYDFLELSQLVAISTLLDDAKAIVRGLTKDHLMTLQAGYDGKDLERVLLAAEEA